MKDKKTPNLWQVVLVLVGFLFLAFTFNSLGIGIHLAIFSGWFLAMFVGKMTNHTYKEMEHAITKGIYNGMEAILILLAVGALVPDILWVKSHPSFNIFICSPDNLQYNLFGYRYFMGCSRNCRQALQ